jgi:hypothetical protein
VSFPIFGEPVQANENYMKELVTCVYGIQAPKAISLFLGALNGVEESMR